MKKHFFSIALSGVISLIVGLPHLVIPRLIHPAVYDPLQFTYGQGSSITMEEVYTYAPEVQDILEGSRFVSDSQVYEYRAIRTPFVGESGDAWIVALFARLSGSLEGGFIASDFVFPFLTSLLVYFLTLFLSRNKIIAVTTAAIVVLWPELIVLIPYPQAMGASLIDAFHPRDFLIMSRSFHPQVSLPSYFLAVVLVIVAVRKKRWWISAVAGIVGGFLFYSYVFSWTAFLGGLGILGVFVVLTRRWESFKHLLIIVGCALLVAIPYMDAAWVFHQAGGSLDFFQKLSLPKRGFSDLVVRHVIFVGLYIFVRRKRWTINDWCFLAFWIAPLVLPNLSQEFLGRDLEGKHWIRRIGYPMSAIGFGITASSLVPKRMLRSVGIVMTSIVLFRAIVLQYSMAKQSAETYRQDEGKYELFDWINNNTEPDIVIASLDWEMITSLPAKTNAFNFAPIGMRTVASTDETIERYLWTYALLGATENEVEQAFSDRLGAQGEGIAVSRSVYFSYATADHVFVFPKERLTEVLGQYRNIVDRVSKNEFPPFRLDYVLVRPIERQLGQNKASLASDSVFNNERFELYAVFLNRAD